MSTDKADGALFRLFSLVHSGSGVNSGFLMSDYSFERSSLAPSSRLGTLGTNKEFLMSDYSFE